MTLSFLFKNFFCCCCFNVENPATNDAHIVREEEGQGSQDQSQLVTSSTNSLASLKRKLESLRSKRGGKRSRLEHGSTGLVSWPVENNVAVSSLKYGHTSMATGTLSLTVGQLGDLWVGLASV